MNSTAKQFAEAVAEAIVADSPTSSVGEVSTLVAVELLDSGYDLPSAELDAIADAAATAALGA